MTGAGPPRIAIFVPSLTGGGVEMNMIHLSRAFADAGFAVDLVLANARGPLRDRVDPRVGVVDLGGRRVLSALPGLARYLRDRRPVVLLAGMMHANLVALGARLLAGTPCRVVISEHTVLGVEWGEGGSHPGRIYPWLARLLYRRAAGIVAVSGDVADDLARLCRLDRTAVTVIGNPVPQPAAGQVPSARPDHPFFAPGSPPVVLGMGRLHRQKAFEILVKAHAHLRRTVDHTLVILGEGPEREALTNLAASLGVDASLALPGFVPDVGPYLAHAAVFALPSRMEGFGNALVEALARGLPVVSTRCPGGPVQILAEGRLGRLVPVDDPEALAEGLAAALASPGPAEPRRERAAEFAVPRIAARYLEVFGLRGAPEVRNVH